MSPLSNENNIHFSVYNLNKILSPKNQWNVLYLFSLFVLSFKEKKGLSFFPALLIRTQNNLDSKK
jgi:hypothetical protein